MTTHAFFAPCPRGLEDLLAEELADLGATAPSVTPGGVAFSGVWRVAYAANLHSRLATRILWRVAHATYRKEDDLYRLAHETPWHRWFAPSLSVRVSVTGETGLRSLNFVTLRIKDGLCDRFRAETGRRPSVERANPRMRIHAFLTPGEATLYLDTSGVPLTVRGYRRAQAEAPLKENLAAGILRLSGWQPGTPLFDPMCGSGTFLLEAAGMALGVPPGAGRPFAFEQMRVLEPETWQALLADVPAPEPAFARIYGRDGDPVALRMARANLTAAGWLPIVRLEQGDMLDAAPPESAGVLVMNPPYGVRLGEADELAALYPRLGDLFKQRFAGWDCWILSADNRLPKLIGLRSRRRIPLFNGPLECRLLHYPMVAGSTKPLPAQGPGA